MSVPGDPYFGWGPHVSNPAPAPSLYHWPAPLQYVPINLPLPESILDGYTVAILDCDRNITVKTCIDFETMKAIQALLEPKP